MSVQGRFELSEFASLGDEELHFLRIFVHCEGSIREMESALGLSYPTIKSRLANLKKRLSLDQPTSAPNAPRRETVGDVLSALESGEISHAESVKFIKAIKSKAGEK